LQPTRAGQSSAKFSTLSNNCSSSLNWLFLGHSTAAADATNGAAVSPGRRDSHPHMPQVPSKDKTNWDRRQQTAGAIARLVVYCRGQMPSRDITLAGGSGRPVHIASVQGGGTAANAGVKTGDRLVSVDGKKNFMDLPAAAIQERLKAPTTLVVMGFIGRLETEVRLYDTEEEWGISNQDAINGELLEFRDVRMLKKRVALMAPLFLTTLPPEKECKEPATCTNPTLQRSSTSIASKTSVQADAQSDKHVVWRKTPGHSTGWTKHVVSAAPCFELRHSEAHSLVQHAMHSATTDRQTEAFMRKLRVSLPQTSSFPRIGLVPDQQRTPSLDIRMPSLDTCAV